MPVIPLGWPLFLNEHFIQELFSSLECMDILLSPYESEILSAPPIYGPRNRSPLK